MILAGGFGSGKTEIALNLAFESALMADNVILADLDLVNPYFASREMKRAIEKSNIKLLAPLEELSLGDVPSLPEGIIGFIKQDNHMVVDLAGDEVGSLVLGYLSDLIYQRDNLEFWLVLNPFRPFASNLEDVLELRKLLEGAAHLKFTGIISNPNLIAETDEDIIIRGHQKVEEFARELQIPVRYLVVEEKFYQKLLPIYGDILRKMRIYLRPDWM